jgi:hypothetical protein
LNQITKEPTIGTHFSAYSYFGMVPVFRVLQPHIPMKKNYLSFVLLVIIGMFHSSLLSGQGAGNDPNESSNPSHFKNPVWLGFNAGPMWQTSDVPVGQLGVGGGITLGKNYLTYTPSKVFIGWRLRYLSGTTYGQDFSRNYGIKNNAALNGTADSTMNYAKNGGFVYNNYKMSLNELSLEVLFGPNMIHRKTGSGPLAYIFGGVGLSKTQTWMNMRGANDSLYNFAKIDPSGKATSTQISSALSAVQDNTYETVADGSAKPSWHFMPSLGIGLGYQFKNIFQIGAEFKTTFALSVPIDGVQWNQDNSLKSLSERYNYGGFFIKFGFGGNSIHSAGTTSGGGTTGGGTTGGGTTGYTGGGGGAGYTPPPAGSKPRIQITYPTANPFTAALSNAQLSASIEFVPFASDIKVNLNGQPISSWHFNSSNGLLNADFNLLPGNNVLTIYANNAYGNDVKSEYFDFVPTHVVHAVPPPVVSIISPTSNPYMTDQNVVQVTASVTGIDYHGDIHLTVNGVTTTNFNFNPSGKQMQFTAALLQGNNYFFIRAVNSAGSDSKSLAIDFNPPAQAGQSLKPVVTLSSAITNPYPVNTASTTIYATVDNVTLANQIQVMVNGAPFSSFMFQPATHQLQFNPGLAAGNNYVYIRATNPVGSDTKSVDVIYTPPVNQAPAPMVNFLNPNMSPTVSAMNNAIILARVDNITDPSQIQVHVNGMNFSNFTYSQSTHNVEFNTPLALGSNSVFITAATPSGTDSKSVQIVYSTPSIPRPVITMVDPVGNPYLTSANTITVKAQVLNVDNQSAIHVTTNGANNPNIVFNAATHMLEFTSTLAQGNNYFYILANNSAGSDNKSLEAVYTPSLLQPVVAITSPLANPFNTTSGNITVVASIKNITSRNDIRVDVNGAVDPNFVYNPATSMLEFTTNLNAGTNYFMITGTTGGGRDFKRLTVNFNPPALPKPVVSFVYPSTNPFQTGSIRLNMLVSIANISSQADLHILFNGAAMNFTYDPATHQAQFAAGLSPGSNYCNVTANNPSGSDSKSLTINYIAPPPAPVVTITSPNRNPAMFTGNSFSLDATVQNVSTKDGIQITVNGTNTGMFAFNPATGAIQLVSPLNRGRNHIVITAVNAGGSDTKTQEILFTPTLTGSGADVPRPKPIVSLNPLEPNSESATVVLRGTVQNVSNSNDIHITQNNTAITGFSFDPASHNLEVHVTLHGGSNVFIVTGLNANGSDTKTVLSNFTQIAKPIISINRPMTGGGNPPPEKTVNVIHGDVRGITGPGEIKVLVNNKQLTAGISYNPTDHSLSFTPTGLVPGINTVEVDATNLGGTETVTFKINYQP